MSQVLHCKNHEEVDLCQCGANRMCLACGYGSGSSPCDCSPDFDFQAWDELSDEALELIEED